MFIFFQHFWQKSTFSCKLHAVTTEITSFPQLVDMKWKLSVGVSSSACRSLNSPYITALVTVTDPSGALLTKSFEMTIGEFKVIYHKV